jgi:hypothetical protein
MDVGAQRRGDPLRHRQGALRERRAVERHDDVADVDRLDHERSRVGVRWGR